jgi:mRNA interferase MazF
MYDPGTVVLVRFPGVRETKPRPCVVVSTPLYHATRPDVILSLLTTAAVATLGPTDYNLQDWAVAGLHKPSLFRVFIQTLPATAVLRVLGKLTDRDWQEVQARLRLALAVP